MSRLLSSSISRDGIEWYTIEWMESLCTKLMLWKWSNDYMHGLFSPFPSMYEPQRIDEYFTRSIRGTATLHYGCSIFICTVVPLFLKTLCHSICQRSLTVSVGSFPLADCGAKASSCGIQCCSRVRFFHHSSSALAGGQRRAMRALE